ncbi:SsrA-binding protein SmpB [Candidatus Proelusimicrobium volucris]|uniref:SsrA-binding protein SmpB n=1 Tax=Candidatus Proelusimicrobium volucris TaxID=3416225 RepID=UPI003D0D6843
MARKKGIEVVSTNRKALHEYFILETFEAGMALFGSEIKSLRLKDCSLDSSFVRMDKGEAYLFNMHIKPYAFNTHTSLDPTRTRKLLLHRKEINKLTAANEIKGQTIVPLEIYLKNGWAKAKIALAKGKKIYDKRETLKKKDLSREMERGFKNKFKL